MRWLTDAGTCQRRSSALIQPEIVISATVALA
jgi:hypothetical protein